MNYPLTPEEAIALVRASDAETLAIFNELDCPLHRGSGPIRGRVPDRPRP